MFRKMMLVPFNDVSANLNSLKNPIESELKSNIVERSHILNNNYLTDESKVIRHSEKLTNFQNMANQNIFSGKSIAPKEEDKSNVEIEFHMLPKISKKTALLFLNELKSHKGIDIDPTTKELIINGRKLVNINIVDLIRDLVKTEIHKVFPNMTMNSFHC